MGGGPAWRDWVERGVNVGAETLASEKKRKGNYFAVYRLNSGMNLKSRMLIVNKGIWK